MHTVHLVGGGPGAMLALRKHFHSALSGTGKPKPLVAYVGTASNDNHGFFMMIRGALALSDARVKLARLASPRAPASEAKELLRECDLVFVSGGDVELGVKLLQDRDAATTLVDLAAAGKPMIGISAGALMLAREWVRFPDDSDDKAEIFPCLGIAPVHVDAHSEDDGWSELRVLVRLLAARGDEDPVGYGLTREGCLRLTLDGAGQMEPLGTPIPRIVVRRGQVVEGKPLEKPEPVETRRKR